jgi:hypothetical protein
MGLCRHCIVRLQLVGAVRLLHLEDVSPVVVVVALSQGLRYGSDVCEQLRIFVNYEVLLGIKNR